MHRADRHPTHELQRALGSGQLLPDQFRRALLEIAPRARDAWLDELLQLDSPPEDGPELPRGCVPYLPCPVDAVLSAVEHARISADDWFVDLGAGVGRSCALVQLLSGAAALGVEIQPELVRAARALQERLHLPRAHTVEGDASTLPEIAAQGTVFFLYCPFGGERLQALLDRLEQLARRRTFRLCAVDLPLPPRPWLARISNAGSSCDVYLSSSPT